MQHPPTATDCSADALRVSASASGCALGSLKPKDYLQTPSWVYEPLGGIDLDPCAAPDTKIGMVNYAIERGEDGLRLGWSGFVYCNPPFSRKGEWAAKMKEHGNGILILPERGSAPWFGPLAMACGRYFVMGQKINFIGGPSSNNLGSVLFPFGDLAVTRVTESGLPGHFVTVESYRPRRHNDPALATRGLESAPENHAGDGQPSGLPAAHGSASSLQSPKPPTN